MFSTSLSRSGRQFWTTTAAARRKVLSQNQYLSKSSPQNTYTSRVVVSELNVKASQRGSHCYYSTTPRLFRKIEIHHDHVNINKSGPSVSGIGAPRIDDSEDSNDSSNSSFDRRKDLLSDVDDLMVGNEGVERISPNDFPELYPGGEEEIEGLNQESHPDDERDFESRDSSSTSVLLTDKERSEKEFSWFVDESYPDTASTTTATPSTEGFSSSDFVPLWLKNTQKSPTEMDSLKQQQQQQQQHEHSADSISALLKMLESERAKNIKVIDMRDKCDWTEWMVVCEGLSERHLGNVADQVYSALKRSSPKSSPPVMEGRDTSDWVVIDAGSVVIHFMTPEARKERDLEGLWAAVKNPLKLKDAEELSWDDIKGKMTKSWKEDHGRSKGEDGKRGRRGERDIPLSEVVKW